MNCTNCGNNIPENSMFCPSCGSSVQSTPTQTPIYQQPVTQPQAPFYQQQAAQPQTPVYQQATQTQAPVYQQAAQQPMYTQPVYGQPAPQKKKSKAPWIALGVSLFLLIVVVALVIILLVSCSGVDNSSPEGVINSYIEALSDNDVEDCLDTLYPSLVDGYVQKGVSEEAIYNLVRSSTLDDLASTSVTLSNLVILEREVLDSDDVADYNEDAMMLPDYITITAGMELSGTVMVSAGSAQVMMEWEAEVVCADGDYYISDFSIYE